MQHASDAKARWAEAWVAWPGFDRFWANVLRDLLPHADSGEVRADFDPATSELVVDYRLGHHVPEPAQPPALFVFGPDRKRIMRLRYWRAARAIRSSITTLVWLAG